MPLPTFDSEADIPEAFRPEYELRDGKWQSKDVAKLSSALEAERTRASTEETNRKKAEQDLAAERRAKAATEKGITAEQLEELRQADAEARKPIETENANLKAELAKLRHGDKVKALALSAEVGIMSDRIEDAMNALVEGPRPRTKLADDGVTILVLDKEGKVTTQTVEAFLKGDFKKEKPWLYTGSGASGSGATGSSGGGEGSPPVASEDQLAAKRSQVAGAF